MRRLLLTAGLLAGACWFATVATQAADLDYGRITPERNYSAYEDPRYRDLFGPDQPPTYRYQPSPKTVYRRDAYPAPVPPGYVYGNPRERHYDPRYGAPGRYANGECLPRHQIKHRLIEQGWQDFHNLELRPRVARMNARQRNGDLYALKVERCRGDVLRADLIEQSGPRPYAFREAPRPYRPYY